MLSTAFLSLGSNVGDREKWIKFGIEKLQLSCGSVLTSSSVYETKAWGNSEQSDFLNCVIELSTHLGAEALLEQIHLIELQSGRSRNIKWGPRELDIDILLFNDLIVASSSLNIPHPLLQTRNFVLIPLAEIAASLVHPVFKKEISAIFQESTDQSQVNFFSTPLF